ncbi:Fe(3+)-hydroxamate ABC transporter permease FhuB [Tranquillimonas rosea]|uniref:Fe(3+)-hydroxamate ABC transporter permease FhuB n=1 Tax=Tranquillimonas rosea TaxID=641238 RepID=UPI003BA8DBBD
MRAAGPGIGAAWLGLALALAVLHVWSGSDLGLARMAALVGGAGPESFADVQFREAMLPRAAMAGLAGFALGLAGSLFQQVTQNRLASPLTLGASSGAWLATIIGTLLAPGLAATHGAWFSFAGAIGAFGLVLSISRLRGLTGLHAVLAGMAVNLFLGAVAGALLLLQSPYFGHLFVWGAGDLGQSGWQWPLWFVPRLAVAVLVAVGLGRVLALLRTGAAGAEARGLHLAPALGAAALTALFLTAISVTAVGMIGFIGLLAPNLARMSGARRPLTELAASAGLGALLLLGTDTIAIAVSSVSRDLVPSGAAAALIGAPALIWLARGRLSAQDHAQFRLPPGPARVPTGAVAAIVFALVAVPVLALVAGQTDAGWRVAVPGDLVLSLRWPRVLAAAAAGAGMALSGVLLQRLIRNPLASPDILGMSSGATFALVATALLAGASIFEIGAGIAVLGSLAVLVLLLWFGRRHGHAPAAVALIGISLGALLDALVKFALASGSEDTFAILGWMGGSTYRVSPTGALTLAAAVALCGALILAFHRWLTLIAAGDDVAAARGLAPRLARPAVMSLAAILAAIVTAFLGPVTFVGLLAPHVAVMLGARRAMAQTALAAVIGALLMVLSDWLGRMMLYPMQLPAGTVASLLGGGYFMALLVFRRRSG